MSSHCTNLAAQTTRLRDAQRAFWLAWKAVEAGDRAQWNAAREAMLSLEEAFFDTTRFMDDAMNPERLVSMERKRDYELMARFQRPDFRKNKWVRISQGRLLAYNENPSGEDRRLTMYSPQDGGRYDSMQRIPESRQVRFIRAIGDNLFCVGYEVGRPSVLQIDAQGQVLHRYSVVLKHNIFLQSVRQLSDGRLCLIWDHGYFVFRQQDETFMLDTNVTHRLSSDQPTVYFDDTIVSKRLTDDGEMNVLIERLDHRGDIVSLADIHIGAMAEYTYSPDGRLIVLDGERRSFFMYGDDGDGTYALQGESSVEWPSDTIHLGRLTMLSFDRALFITSNSAEVWRIRPGVRAVRETRVSVPKHEASIRLLPDHRLVLFNRISGSPAETPLRYTMQLWSLDEHGQYDIEQEIPQEDYYLDVTSMSDGRLLVNANSSVNPSMVYDGTPILSPSSV